MANRYKMFLQLFEKWPLDKAKAGRDLGAIIREQVGKAFSAGETTAVNEKECDKALDSLNKINNNFHKNNYAMPSNYRGCTGLSLDELTIVTSTEMLQSLNS